MKDQWLTIYLKNGDYQISKTGKHFPEVEELLKKMGDEK